MIKNKKTAVFAVAVIFLMLLCGCRSEMPENTVKSVRDIEGSIVGVLAGTAAEESIEKNGTAGEIKRYYNTEDIAEALKSGVIDCAVVDGETGENILDKNRKLVMLSEPFADQGYRIAVTKGNEQLLEMLRAAVKDLVQDGTIDDIVDGWLEDNESVYVPAELAEDARTITVAVTEGIAPYAVYNSEETITGLEPDILRAVCDRLGVSADIRVAEKDEVIYLVESGKVSLAIGHISETDSADLEYTETYLSAEQYVLVRSR